MSLKMDIGLNIMDELFQQLEVKIKALLQRNEALKQANLGLKQSKLVVIHEKQTLAAKNRIAVLQIKKMISHFKSMESDS